MSNVIYFDIFSKMSSESQNSIFKDENPDSKIYSFKVNIYFSLCSAGGFGSLLQKQEDVGLLR